MSYHVPARRVRCAVTFCAAFGLTTAAFVVDLAVPSPTHAMSCFMVAQKMSCIDGVATVPLTPLEPQIMIPVGPAAEGESHDLVIEDDGGYEAARG
jgi:hypothetical protein